ncbi:MAG: HEAT repeat domain-containing protein [Gemmatimonadaceae bacterium]|nr:HEAT repeat domain-containing protein [Gemmatimonadaceae bacterium]
MDYSITFARHFARFVFLLLHDPLNTDEQKVVLRALVIIAREGFVMLGARAGQLTANGTSLPHALSGVTDVIDRMTVHAIRTIDVDRNAAPADMLRIARQLIAAPSASAPVPGRSARLTRMNATPSASIPAQAPRVTPTNEPFDFGDLLGDPLGDPLGEVMQGELAAGSPALLQPRASGEASVETTLKPALLKAVVIDLARSSESRAQGIAILARAGEDGATALIEQLTAEAGPTERRLYLDALASVQAGVPTLVQMLGDPQWFVARNAANVLGEMKARDAEQALAALLHHDDERVRHAATVALMRLGTALSFPTIRGGLKDGAPHIRMFAAAALVGRTESNVTTLLLDALDEERDEQVALSFLAVLGRLATPDAVTRLNTTAEPDKGLFRKKSAALRVGAVQALAECSSEPAIAALRVLQGDRDAAVRAAAVDALGRRVRLADPA